MNNDYEKDGVIYTPGNKSNGGAARPVQKKAPPVRKAGVKRKKKPQKSQVGVFLAATLFTGIVVVIVVVALMFAPMFGGGNNETETPRPQTPDNTPAEAVPQPILRTTSATALVKSAYEGRLELYDLNAGRSYNLTVDSATPLFDRHGGAIVFDEIKPGDIVDVDFAESAIITLHQSRLSDERRRVSLVHVDTLENKVQVGAESFTYNEHLILNGITELSQIDPIDEVSFKFYKNVIWYMELTQGHGFLNFDNIGDIEGGIIEVNNDMRLTFDEPMPLKLSEGRHHVVIRGSNITPLVREVILARGETEIIDLSEAEIVLGRLTFNVNQTDYKVYISGEEIDLKEPVELPFGTYPVVIEKEGFVPWEGEAQIDSPLNVLNVTLTERIMFCRFTVITVPEGAEIYIDSAFYGISPCTINVEYGTRTITYRKEGYKVVDPFVITLDTPTLTEPVYIIMQEDVPFMPEY